MPCRTDYPEDRANEINTLNKHIAFLEAALCASLNALEKESLKYPINLLDYDEAGITKTRLEKWFNNHKEIDKQRKVNQALVEERKALKEKALSKLSDEECKVLGIKR